jgi:hypothetical protein
MSSPEVITVNSEALEATIRDLLPSQRGFGSELQASNVIMPIIDLTPTAEGSALSTDLARAINFGGATTFSVNNTSASPAAGLGFYRLTGCACMFPTSAGSGACIIRINDGSSDKDVWQSNSAVSSGQSVTNVFVDLIVFLRSQDTLTVVSTTGRQNFSGSVRQIADGNGTTITPTGFEVE